MATRRNLPYIAPEVPGFIRGVATERDESGHGFKKMVVRDTIRSAIGNTTISTDVSAVYPNKGSGKTYINGVKVREISASTVGQIRAMHDEIVRKEKERQKSFVHDIRRENRRIGEQGGVTLKTAAIVGIGALLFLALLPKGTGRQD